MNAPILDQIAPATDGDRVDAVRAALEDGDTDEALALLLTRWEALAEK